MAKTTGLGDNLYLDGYDVSGDIGSIQSISNKRALLDVTGLDKDAHERLPGLGDAEISFTSFYNPSDGTDPDDLVVGAHEILKNILNGRHVLYFRGTVLGGAVAAMIGAQASYKLDRSAQGALTGEVQVMNAGGKLVEWGRSLTAGKHTSVAPENLPGVLDQDYPNGSVGKLSAYLQVMSIVGAAGNDITVKLQHSDYGSAIAVDDDAVLLITNLLNNHTYAPTGVGFSLTENRRVTITIADTTPSIVAGTVRIVGTNYNGDVQTEDVSIAGGAGAYTSTKFYRTVTSIVTLNNVTVLGGAGDETIKVGVEAAVVTYTDIAAGSFANVDVAVAPYKEHLDIAASSVKRYMRAVVGTVSGFTSAIFAVAVKRY
jgi:hypothetical protein